MALAIAAKVGKALKGAATAAKAAKPKVRAGAGARALAGTVLGVGRQSFKAAPVAATVTAAGTVGFTGSLLMDGGEGVGGRARLAEEFEAMRQQREMQERLQRRVERITLNRTMNVQRLAQFSPHIYNELLAGERLAQGEVVVGGSPRTDLLDEVARMMGEGLEGLPRY